MSNHLPILIIALPMFAGFILPIVKYAGPKFCNLFVFAVLAAVNVMVFSILPELAFDGGSLFYVLGSSNPQSFAPEALAFPVRIVLKVDSFSLFMAMISSIVALSVFLFSIRFIKEEARKNYYMILMLLLLSGIMGLKFTNDLFNFFVFLEMLSISSAALVAYRLKSKASAYAGYKYMLISTISTGFFLIATGLLYAQYGSLNIDYIHMMMGQTILDRIALVMMVMALAMKAGAVPMHMWVPDAYAEAPAPVTGMLIMASQASLYGLFRISFSLFGNPVSAPEINYLTLGWIIIISGVLSMFIGVTMAIIQNDVKRLMAYHAVSQTGYMLLGVGVGMAVYTADDGGAAFESYGALAMTGGIFHIMNYAFCKVLLFLTAGVMYLRFGSPNLNNMMGLAHKDRFLTVAFIIGALAIAGIPPFNGFASKIIIYQSVYLFNPLLSIIAMFVSVLTLASFTKVFYSAFLGPERKDMILNAGPVSAGMKWGMGILCVLIIMLGLFPDFVINVIVSPAVSSLAIVQ